MAKPMRRGNHCTLCGELISRRGPASNRHFVTVRHLAAEMTARMKEAKVHKARSCQGRGCWCGA